MNFVYGCRDRTDDLGCFPEMLLHGSSYGFHDPAHQLLIFSRHLHAQHMAGRRIVHQSPVAHLLTVKGRVILGCRRLDAVMLRHVGLDQGSARLSSPSGAPGCLNQKLKSPLRRREIRRIQGHVCRQHPHQGHPWKVMPFHDHLGANEYVCLSLCKSR